jgi:DNA invertase Pin-like site-specific DNA recombinase
LAVWRLDRFGHSVPDLVRIVGDLEHRGVALESLSAKFETGSETCRLILHVFASLAEFERNLLREHTKEGLVADHAHGRLGGRKQKLDDKHTQEIRALLRDPAMLILLRVVITWRAPRCINPARRNQS